MNPVWFVHQSEACKETSHSHTSALSGIQPDIVVMTLQSKKLSQNESKHLFHRHFSSFAQSPPLAVSKIMRQLILNSFSLTLIRTHASRVNKQWPLGLQCLLMLRPQKCHLIQTKVSFTADSEVFIHDPQLRPDDDWAFLIPFAKFEDWVTFPPKTKETILRNISWEAPGVVICMFFIWLPG